MSKFETKTFHDGCLKTEFIAHANKFTIEEALRLCCLQSENMFESGKYRKPTVADVNKRTVRYYVRIPEFCGLYGESGGCYTFCDAGERGSFPVWSIEFAALRAADGGE